jgi:hypothetical protein
MRGVAMEDSVSALTLLSSTLTFLAVVITLGRWQKAQKSPHAAGWFGELGALLCVLVRAAELHLDLGFLAVLSDWQPLQIRQLIAATADKRLAVVYMPAWAGSGFLASGWAGVELAELSFDGLGAWRGQCAGRQRQADRKNQRSRHSAPPAPQLRSSPAKASSAVYFLSRYPAMLAST